MPTNVFDSLQNYTSKILFDVKEKHASQLGIPSRAQEKSKQSTNKNNSCLT